MGEEGEAIGRVRPMEDLPRTIPKQSTIAIAIDPSTIDRDRRGEVVDEALARDEDEVEGDMMDGVEDPCEMYLRLVTWRLPTRCMPNVLNHHPPRPWHEDQSNALRRHPIPVVMKVEKLCHNALWFIHVAVIPIM